MGLMTSNRRTAEEKLRARGVAPDENNQMPNGHEQRSLEPALHQTSTEYVGENPVLDPALREPTETGGPHNPIPVARTYEFEKLNPDISPAEIRKMPRLPQQGYELSDVQEASTEPDSANLGMKESEVKAQEVKSKRVNAEKEELSRKQTERKEELREKGQEERDLSGMHPPLSETPVSSEPIDFDTPLVTDEEEITPDNERNTKRRRK